LSPQIARSTHWALMAVTPRVSIYSGLAWGSFSSWKIQIFWQKLHIIKYLIGLKDLAVPLGLNWLFYDQFEEFIIQPGGPIGHRMQPASIPSNKAITPAAPGNPGTPASPGSKQIKIPFPFWQINPSPYVLIHLSLPEDLEGLEGNDQRGNDNLCVGRWIWN